LVFSIHINNKVLDENGNDNEQRSCPYHRFWFCYACREGWTPTELDILVDVFECSSALTGVINDQELDSLLKKVVEDKEGTIMGQLATLQIDKKYLEHLDLYDSRNQDGDAIKCFNEIKIWEENQHSDEVNADESLQILNEFLDEGNNRAIVEASASNIYLDAIVADSKYEQNGNVDEKLRKNISSTFFGDINYDGRDSKLKPPMLCDINILDPDSATYIRQCYNKGRDQQYQTKSNNGKPSNEKRKKTKITPIYKLYFI
jgi:hypothetical protein